MKDINMPTKEKFYNRVVFTPEVIKEAVNSLVTALPHNERKLILESLEIRLPSGERWELDNEDEFYADYIKGFTYASFRKGYEKADLVINVHLTDYGQQYSRVQIEMPDRANVEKVFYVFEANVEKCRLPKQPDKESTKSKKETEWISKTIDKIEGRHPVAGRKLKLALSKLESEDVEEWQSAMMNIRDAWIELTQWLCKVNNIDTSDIQADAVVDRLKKLKIDKTDDRLFNLARDSFNLSMKHHAREIDIDTATACVISTIVSMQTVIRETFNAKRQS